jgi:hypothetical protein
MVPSARERRYWHRWSQQLQPAAFAADESLVPAVGNAVIASLEDMQEDRSRTRAVLVSFPHRSEKLEQGVLTMEPSTGLPRTASLA